MRLGIPLKGDIISPSNEADRFVRVNLKDGKINKTIRLCKRGWYL